LFQNNTYETNNAQSLFRRRCGNLMANNRLPLPAMRTGMAAEPGGWRRAVPSDQEQGEDKGLSRRWGTAGWAGVPKPKLMTGMPSRLASSTVSHFMSLGRACVANAIAEQLKPSRVK
jgi:hypothetical protein